MPHKISPNDIKSCLQTETFGREIYCHDSLDSTMNEASRIALNGVKEGTVVIAESQTKGRGRFGRNWVSPAGSGIYLSIVLRPTLAANEIPKLTLLASVAVCQAIQKVVGFKTKIKWPNDLLVNQKKLAGFLTEMNSNSGYQSSVILGMGINVNSALSDLPEHSTSIKNEIGKNVSRVELIIEILSLMEKWYIDVNTHGFSTVMKNWKELSETLGRRVRIDDSTRVWEGKAVDLDSSGGLMIENDEGTIIRSMTGDVVEL